MKYFHMALMMITMIPLLLITVVVLPFALLGIFATMIMGKISNTINEFSREIERISKEIR